MGGLTVWPVLVHVLCMKACRRDLRTSMRYLNVVMVIVVSDWNG